MNDEYKSPKKSAQRGGRGGGRGGKQNSFQPHGKQTRYQGVVTQLNIGENYGVVKRNDDGKQFFFHLDGLELKLNAAITFLLKMTNNDEVAYNIQLAQAFVPASQLATTTTTTTISTTTSTPTVVQATAPVTGDSQKMLHQITQLHSRLIEKDKQMEELITAYQKALQTLQSERKTLKEDIKIAAECKANLELMVVAEKQAPAPQPITDINKLLQLVPALLAQNKIAEAVEIIPKNLNTLPDSMIIQLFKTLENPRMVPYAAMHTIIQMTRQRVKYLLNNASPKESAEFLETFRIVVSSLGRNINIRSIPSTTHALLKILESIDDFFPKTIPFADRCTFAMAIQCQSYLSAFMTVAPKKSYRLMKLYAPYLAKVREQEETRSKKLKEYSNRVKSACNAPLPPSAVVEENNTAAVAPTTQLVVENEPSIENNLTEPISELPSPIPEVETIDEEQQKTALAKIDYKSITLEVMAMVKEYQQSAEEKQKKIDMVADLSTICKDLYSDLCMLYMYGSSESNFGTAGCDVDLCVHFPTTKIADANQQVGLLKLLQLAVDSQESKFPQLKSKEEVVRSRVPILKIVDKIRGIDCDIGIDNYLGVVNTRMLKTYSLIDERVQPFILAVKYWAKQRHINNPSAGSLSSYAYVLLAIMYLQIEEVVPSLQMLASDPNVDPEDIPQPHFVNAYNCQYYGNVEKLKTIWSKNTLNTKSVGELVVGFFKYYAREFNYNKFTATIKEGKPIPKKWNNAISVEDPFETRCLGGVVIDELAQIIVAEFRRAFTILTNGGSFTDVTREREDYEDENIYRKRENYSEYITKEEAEKLIEQGKLYRGVLRVNKKSKFHEAYVTVDGIANDFYIPGFKNRNRAIHGDIVAIQVLEEKQTGIITTDDNPEDNPKELEESELQATVKANATATVVCILEKGSPRLFACKMMKQDDNEKSKGFRWLCPLDKAYPRIMIRYDEFREVLDTTALQVEEMLFVAEINYPWKSTSHYPKGRILGSLGVKKDMYAQKKALLLQNMPALYEDVYGQPTAASANDKKKQQDKSVSVVPQANATVEVNDIAIDVEAEVAKGYKDWRKRRVFTIDPITSRDLDDALSIEQVSDSEYLVTVYVADVTRIVQEGGPVDLEARRRATSVYMINQVEHMLDPKLSQNLCSILPGVTRFAIAVQFKMNQDAVIDEKSIEFAKAIICSCVQLDYDSVQLMIEGKPLTRTFQIKNDVTMEQVKQDCLILNKLAQTIRQKRKDAGSLFLHNQEIEFKVDELGLPISCSYSVHNESHELVEEFMLIANRMAGKATYDHFKENAVLRCHSSPDLKKWYLTMSKLTIGAKKIGFIEKDFPLDQMLADQVPTQKIMNTFIKMLEKYPTHQRTIQQALLREMQLAKYVRVGDLEEASNPHYALNMSFYTHFTSPIRRYADVLVHRMLVAMIDAQFSQQPIKAPQLQGKELTALVEHLNEYNYMAKCVDEDISRQYLAFYLSPILFTRIVRTEAVVVSLGRRSFTIYIPKYCTEIQCNVMRDFAPEPKSLKEVEHQPSEEEPELPQVIAEKLPQETDTTSKRKENVIIDSLTITWCVDEKGQRVAPPKSSISDSTTPAANPSVQLSETSMELRVMKTILVDLDVDYEAVPYDIEVYNVWEKDCALTDEEQVYQQPEKAQPVYMRSPNSYQKQRGSNFFGSPRGRGRNNY